MDRDNNWPTDAAGHQSPNTIYLDTHIKESCANFGPPFVVYTYKYIYGKRKSKSFRQDARCEIACLVIWCDLARSLISARAEQKSLGILARSSRAHSSQDTIEWFIYSIIVSDYSDQFGDCCGIFG